MRWQFALALADIAAADARVHLLYCDVGGGLFADFARLFPGRAHNLGLAEQSAVSIASGLALGGLRPVVYSFTPFLLERAFEQVKLDVAQQLAPVGLVGFTDPSQGPTHTAIGTRTLLSTLPAIQALFPRTKEDVRSAVRTVDPDRPWFLSLR